MGVYRKDNRWYIDYYLPDGKRKREIVTVPGVDPSKIGRQDALRALSIRKGQIAEGKFEIAQTKKPVIFDKLVERYLEYSKANKRSSRRDVTSSKMLLRTFGGKTLQQITTWLVEKYKGQRQKDITPRGNPVSNKTINRELACLKHMFTKAIEWGLIAINPVKKVKLFPEKQEKLRVISEAEFRELYSAASPHFRPILLGAYQTGMRKGELARLRWEDINFKDGYIYIKETKNNESRIIPLSDILMESLITLKKKATSDYVFTTQEGLPYLSESAWKRAWATALRKSQIEKCRFHDLRHSFATRLVMTGVDIILVGRQRYRVRDRMQSEARPRWLVQVSGEPGVLDDVAVFLSSLNVNIVEQVGERYLTSPRFEALSDAKAVLDLANEILAVVDGMLSVTTGVSGRLKVERVFQADDESRPATQYIFFQGDTIGKPFRNSDHPERGRSFSSKGRSPLLSDA